MGGLCYSSAARFRLLIKRLRADQQPEDNIATRNHRVPSGQSLICRAVGPDSCASSGPGNHRLGDGRHRETIFAPRVGAVFGYAMLWVVLAAVVFKAVQVYAGARYIVLTGEHPLRAWSRIPGPRAWVAKLLGVVSVMRFPDVGRCSVGRSRKPLHLDYGYRERVELGTATLGHRNHSHGDDVESDSDLQHRRAHLDFDSWSEDGPHPAGNPAG